MCGKHRKKMDEKSQIHSAQKGDIEAFNQLVMQYQEIAYSHALWLVKDPAEADDVTQDSFIKAYHSLPSFRGGSFRSWLLRIVTNTSYDVLRKQKRAAEVSLLVEDEDGEEEDYTELLADPGLPIEEQLERSELSKTVQQYLDELVEEYRQTVYLIDVLELDYSEVSHILDVPIGTVKSRVARGRLKLRNRLVENLGRIPAGTQTSIAV
jgi:RNA polymerase sigma-70 factor, ECF subfamily